MTAAAVAVFAKAPRPGAVKTRLCPPLSPTVAARLYRCFLLDTLDAVRALPGITPVVAYAPRRARAFFAARTGMALVPQTGPDLGARMAGVFGRLFARGFGAVVIVGSDSPTLPDDRLHRALRILRAGAADGVIGPSQDGGYYLIGLRAPCPRLFVGVPWSTDRVLARTLANARRARRRLVVLPPWYDVDTPDDLRRLAADLETPGRWARRTRRLLRQPRWRGLTGGTPPG